MSENRWPFLEFIISEEEAKIILLNNLNRHESALADQPNLTTRSDPSKQ
jgi:hypothetical protein